MEDESKVAMHEDPHRRPENRIDAWLARFVPDDLPADDLRVWPRALLLLRFTLIGVVFTVLLTPYFAVTLGYPVVALINTFYAGSLGLTAVILRRTRSVELAAHWAMGNAAFMLVAEGWVLGGMDSPAIPWLAGLPVGGLLLCGRRGGLVWGVFAIAAIASIGLCHASGWIPGAAPVEPAELGATLVSTIAMVGALGTLSWLSESRAADLVDHLERERLRLRDLSVRDPLTGLANRALLSEYLAQSYERCRRHPLRGALYFLDLDRFKPINDEFGHVAGDAVLREVANRLTGLLRRTDLGARLGGDEFALVVEGLRSDVQAAAVAEKIADAIEAPIDLGGHFARVGISIGIAFYPDDDDASHRTRITLEQVERLLKRADHAMYEAKRAGRRYAID